jgi:hypothetical protein
MEISEVRDDRRQIDHGRVLGRNQRLQEPDITTAALYVGTLLATGHTSGRNLAIALAAVR